MKEKKHLFFLQISGWLWWNFEPPMFRFWQSFKRKIAQFLAFKSMISQNWTSKMLLQTEQCHWERCWAKLKNLQFCRKKTKKTSNNVFEPTLLAVVAWRHNKQHHKIKNTFLPIDLPSSNPNFELDFRAWPC